MNIKTTVVLLVVCLAIGLYVFLVERPGQAPAPAAKETVEKTLFDPKPEGIDRVELTRKGEPTIAMVKEAAGEEWNLEAPIKAPARKYDVEGVIRAVAEMKCVKEFGPKDPQRPSDKISGLKEPSTVVKLIKAGKPIGEVLVGERQPTGVGFYVQVAGSDKILVSKDDPSYSLNKKLDDLREKRVLNFLMDKVERVQVEGLQNFELVKGEGGKWMMEKPYRGRADKTAVENFIRPLSSLSADAFKDDAPTSYKLYGLEKPRLKITLETKREIPAKAKPGDANTKPADTQPSIEAKTYVVMIGGPTDTKNESFFARLDSAPWVFSLRKTSIDTMAPEAGNLRDKTIAVVDSTKVTRIQSETPGGPLDLTKESEKWFFADKTEADFTLVADLIKTVRDLKATSFVDPSTTPIDVDWSKPRARITLTLAGEPNPVTMLVGPASTSGRMVYVRNAAEDGVAAVPEDTIAQLLQGGVSYRNRSVLTFDRERVRKIELTRKGGKPIELTRTDSDRTWRMRSPVPAEADADAVRNLLQDVSSLSAKKVVAVGDKAKYGLDDPEVALAVHVHPLPPATQATAPAAPPVVSTPPATKPVAATEEESAVMASGNAPAATAATASSRPASKPATGEDRDTKVLKELLEFQKTNPQENPLATKMLQEMLAKKSGQAASQPQATTQLSRDQRDAEIYKLLLEYQKTNPDENPAVTQLLKDLLAAKAGSQPAATQPAAGKKSDLAQEIKVIKDLLEYQKTNPNENRLATEMLKDLLAEKLAGRPAAASAPAVALPPPAPAPIVYRLQLAQKDGVTYACVADHDTVYELEAKVFEDVTAEMRNRQIAKFTVDEVTELAFKTKAAQITLRKDGENWKYVEDPVLPIDSKKVTDVLNAFREMRTHRFVEYAADDLGTYGLAAEDVDGVNFALKSGQKTELLLSANGPAADADKSRYATLGGTKQVFLLKGDQAVKFEQKIRDFEKSANAPADNATPPAAPGMGSPGGFGGEG
ncbi:MAG TPA: DUF4340 domain-containing protein [Phycisphaerae bacterium]|nr:DUF4340 domain-containing protein [Phycisphaerae bacterium]HRY70270.1 DUF4340 domain-containing protein [Phycisphaerae bacterium]HSA27559.1 DUF4340 domain-containing protein [Phycisphaerae bacterium]